MVTLVVVVSVVGVVVDQDQDKACKPFQLILFQFQVNFVVNKK